MLRTLGHTGTETIEVKRRNVSKMTLLSVLDLLDVVHAVLPSDAYVRLPM